MGLGVLADDTMASVIDVRTWAFYSPAGFDFGNEGVFWGGSRALREL